MNVFRLSAPISRSNRKELSSKPEFRQYISNPTKPQRPVTKDSLQKAYDEIMASESRLSHLLSRAHMQLEEKTEMFEQAVEFGERLHFEVETLRDRLGKELDTIFSLRSELKTERDKNIILSNIISEFDDAEQRTQKLEVEAYAMRAKLAEQKEYSEQVQNEWRKTKINASQMSKDVSAVSVEIERLRREVEKERFLRLAVVEELSLVQRKLREMTRRHNEVLAKQRSAETSLRENEANYSSILIELSAEKGDLQNVYNELYNEYIRLEEELTEMRMIRDQSPSVSTVVISSSVRSRLPLSAQFESEKPEKPTKDEDCIRQYLHITATVVKLHFPDMDVKSEKLINKVTHSPFYLYYDLMMELMRSIRRKNDVELERRSVLVVSTKTNELAPMPQSSWLSRFMSLVQRKAVADEDSKTKVRVQQKSVAKDSKTEVRVKQKSVAGPRISLASLSSDDNQISPPQGVKRQGTTSVRL